MTAPTLTDLKDATFFEKDVSAAPRIIDGDVTLTDVEGDAANGQLRVHGLLAEDIVSLFNEGMGAGQVGFDAMSGAVTWGGLLIGMATGGNGTDFVIAFNGGATLAAVEAVIEHLTYANASNAPQPTSCGWSCTTATSRWSPSTSSQTTTRSEGMRTAGHFFGDVVGSGPSHPSSVRHRRPEPCSTPYSATTRRTSPPPGPPNTKPGSWPT